MTAREYLSDCLRGLLLHLISMVALAAFLFATGTAGGVVEIILIVWVLGLFISRAVIYLSLKARLDELYSIMDGLERKYLFFECAAIPKNNYERKLFELIRKSGKAMIEAVSDTEVSSREYREYIESWVHEIKAPITAAGLICRNIGSGTSHKLEPELASIENHVERALFYARAESQEKDFLIKQTCLSNIVSQAVEKHRALLIQSDILVETEGLEQIVYTDSKWAAFMLSQLIQNSVRYRSENPVISISGKALGQQVQLIVCDNGIGIAPHELPRIFDRGFTGSNGRERGGSTGMGLYICQRLAAHMSVDLRAESEVGKGTVITLIFPSKVNLSKV